MKKTLQMFLALLFIVSTTLLSACGGSQAIAETPEKGPYRLPSNFEYYYQLDYNETCKDTWVSKAKSGDSNFAGFEIVSEAINTDTHKYTEYDALEAYVTYHVFLESITIENYLVNILDQTVVYVGGPNEEPAQALDPNAVLARANELAKTAPDLRIGALYTYFPEKYDTEDWSNEVVIQCDPTNTVIFTIPW